MEKAEFTVQIELSEEKIWEKLKDLSLACNYVPGVKSIIFNTKKLKGKGTSRKVLPQKLDETVIKWNEGSGYTLKLHKGYKDSFFPFKKAYFEYRITNNPEGIYLCLAYIPSLSNFVIRNVIKRRVRKIANNMKKFYEE